MPLRVMVVDDEPEVLALIKAMVEPLGCDVLALTDSREAARKLEIEKFDGVLLDFQMPHLDGLELTKAARASHLNGKVPIVMLTGYDNVEMIRKCFSAGVTFFLGKPFTRERVYSMMSSVRGCMLGEKRRHARLPFRAAVHCRSSESRRGHFKSGSLDISEGGMLLAPSGGLERHSGLGPIFSNPI